MDCGSTCMDELPPSLPPPPPIPEFLKDVIEMPDLMIDLEDCNLCEWANSGTTMPHWVYVLVLSYVGAMLAGAIVYVLYRRQRESYKDVTKDKPVLRQQGPPVHWYDIAVSSNGSAALVPAMRPFGHRAATADCNGSHRILQLSGNVYQSLPRMTAQDMSLYPKPNDYPTMSESSPIYFGSAVRAKHSKISFNNTAQVASKLTPRTQRQARRPRCPTPVSGRSSVSRSATRHVQMTSVNPIETTTPRYSTRVEIDGKQTLMLANSFTHGRVGPKKIANTRNKLSV